MGVFESFGLTELIDNCIRKSPKKFGYSTTVLVEVNFDDISSLLNF